MSKSLVKAAVLVSLVLAVASPLSTVQAQTRASDPNIVLAIEQLRREVLRLQALLEARRAALPVSAITEVYESQFFPIPFEAVYAVGEPGLARIDRNTPVRPIDQQLYDLLVAVVGETELQEYVDDFRVFHDTESAIGAFVESKADSDYWLLGVNRDRWRATDRRSQASFIQLFLHEYAHLLLLENSYFTETYANRFWTKADYEHARIADRAADMTRRFILSERYFEDNTDRFVSSYATISVDEDMAETFVRFVIMSRPRGDEVIDEKIRYFYTSPTLVSERDRLRQNLRALNVSLSRR